MSNDKNNPDRRLCAGEWVEVLSKERILATLDKNGRLEELPFMPQMLQYCGKKFRVIKRAHKLCDTVNSTGARKMNGAVFLEGLRCDGSSHGGCEMSCLIFWKEAWLQRTGPPGESLPSSMGAMPSDVRGAGIAPGCTEADLQAGTRAQSPPGDTEPRYVCQATQLPHATRRLPMWDFRQYLEDYTSGNATLFQLLTSVVFTAYGSLAEAGLGFGTPLRYTFNLVQRLRGGTLYPSLPGHLRQGSRTPSATLNLHIGDEVRVKSQEAILDSVDEFFKNRGMTFHPEMVPYCGRTFRVQQRVGKIMNEKTGQMMTLKNECLVLEGAFCIGKFTKPLCCPRDCYPYWREVWLERVDPQSDDHPSGKGS